MLHFHNSLQVHEARMIVLIYFKQDYISAWTNRVFVQCPESWVGLGCGVKINCPHLGPGPVGDSTLRGGLTKGS